MCFFFNDTATTEIYTLSLHDALPISRYIGPELMDLPPCVPAVLAWAGPGGCPAHGRAACGGRTAYIDRKSTRLNSSHANISYAVFCLKKKKLSSPTYVVWTKVCDARA